MLVICEMNFKAKFNEKIWTEAGLYIGGEKCMVMIISRALFGIKSSGGACKANLIYLNATGIQFI